MQNRQKPAGNVRKTGRSGKPGRKPEDNSNPDSRYAPKSTRPSESGTKSSTGSKPWTGEGRPSTGSRPSAGGGRPSTGGRPSASGSRPWTGEGRPSTGGRPSAGGGRPSTGGRPSAGGSRPSAGGSRPSAGGSRPWTGEGRPPAGGRPSTGGRPSAGGSRPWTGEGRPSTGGSRPWTGEGRPPAGGRPSTGGRPSAGGGRPSTGGRPSAGERKPWNSEDRPSKGGRPSAGERKPWSSEDRPSKGGRPSTKKSYDGSERLNKYIANSGVCSRREADVLIATGAITVNGQIVSELGSKVQPGDVVAYGGQRLNNERKVYVLLNKPKDYITTLDDPQSRKTVIDLVKSACRERIYPVGRLDRNTTGLLLFTNDGDLTKKLTHPKHGVQKLYHVHLDKAFTKGDMEEITKGLTIDGEKVIPDKIAYVDPQENKKEIGIEIHSGQNRVVRRMFEHFGYNVVKLDRVIFAGLTKKDLPRGKWRFLTQKEVSFLKMQG